MSLLDNIKGLIGLAAKPKPQNELAQTIAEILTKKKKTAVNRRVFAIEKNIADWRRHIDDANSAPYYKKLPLYELYKQAIFDAQTFAQINSRKNGTLAEEGVLLRNESEDKEASKILDSVAFQNIINTILDSIFWGDTALEIANNDGALQVYTIAPEHLCTVRNVILPEPNNPTSTLPFEAFPNLCVFKSGHLGLLALISRCELYKRFSISDWARHSERFGTPFIYYQTSETREEELAKINQMLGNFGNNGYALADPDDTLTLLNQNVSGKPHEIYLEMVRLQDEQISKIIVGQTGTADQKAYVGAAEVQERILDWYVERDMIYVINMMNDVLMPILAKNKLVKEGLRFDFRFFYEKQGQKAPEQKTLSVQNLAHANFYKACDCPSKS
jgi:hypothetical protein